MMHSLWTLSVQLGARRDTHHVQITNRGEQAVKQAPPRTDAARLLRPLQAPYESPPAQCCYADRCMGHAL